MSRYDLVMFDMDGTLMDSRAFHQKVFYRFLNRYVGNITEEEVRRGIGATVREIFDSAGVPEENLKELFVKLDEFCRTQVMDSRTDSCHTGRLSTVGRFKKQRDSMRTAYKFHAGSNRKYAESQRPVEFFCGGLRRGLFFCE